MPILHKFRDHKVNPDTRILFLGTFNPDVPGNPATFFYGRQPNRFWELLPTTLGHESLLEATDEQKKAYMRQHGFDLADIIHSLDNLPLGNETNYSDKFIDQYVSQWSETIELIHSLKHLKKVFVTRISFLQGVPNMRKRMRQIRQELPAHVTMCGLITPSMNYRNMPVKRTQWHRALNQSECRLDL